MQMSVILFLNCQRVRIMQVILNPQHITIILDTYSKMDICSYYNKHCDMFLFMEHVCHLFDKIAC